DEQRPRPGAAERTPGRERVRATGHDDGDREADSCERLTGDEPRREEHAASQAALPRPFEKLYLGLRPTVAASWLARSPTPLRERRHDASSEDRHRELEGQVHAHGHGEDRDAERRIPRPEPAV